MMLEPNAIRSLDECSSNNMSCALPEGGWTEYREAGWTENTEKLVGLNPEEVVVGLRYWMNANHMRNEW